MSEAVKKVFQHADFAIWHIPRADGYVYEAAGVAIDDGNYHDSPFEERYEDALNAACELYDIDIGSLGIPLAVVYTNALFSVYVTPEDEYCFNFAADIESVPTLTGYEQHPGKFYNSREEAIIAAFELELEQRQG